MLKQKSFIHVLFAADRKSIVHKSIYQKALNGSETECWKKAILEEYNLLIENQIWDLVRFSKGRKALSAK